MATIRPTTTGHAIFEQILDEHKSLREKLKQIHSVLGGTEITTEQMGTLLGELQSELSTHFCNEDKGGFFDEIAARAPHLTDQARKLCVEHQAMLTEVAELCRIASEGAPAKTWWQELGTRFHEFRRRLMLHEGEENRLLQQAYQDDIGNKD